MFHQRYRQYPTNYRKRKKLHSLNQQLYIENLPEIDICVSSCSTNCTESSIDESNQSSKSRSSDEMSGISLEKSNEKNPNQKEYVEAVFLAILSYAGLNLSEADKVVNLFNCVNTRFSIEPILLPSIRHFWEKQARMISIHVYILCEKNHAHGPYIGEPKHFQPYQCEQDYIPAVIGNGNSFIHIPLRSQLEKYLSLIPYDSWQIDETLFPFDVANSAQAKAVKSVAGENGITKYTLTLHADEVSCSKSSPIKIFPIFITINELNPIHRRNYFFLVGLFVGKDKPSVDCFLGPICQEIEELSSNPVKWQREMDTFRSTFHLISLIADAPMRAYLRNVKQYNHLNGCDWCLIQASSSNGARVYPNLTQSAVSSLKRTKKDFLDLATFLRNDSSEIEENLIPRFKGLNGISPLLIFDDFDIVQGLAVEPMHSISLGVFRKLVMNGFLGNNVHIFEKNVSKNFFIKEVGKRLESIKIPSELVRKPRHLDHVKYWKSSEYDSFLCYYSFAVLRGLVKPALIRHISTLSRVYYLCHVGVIDSATVQEIKNLVEEFQKGSAAIFGSTFLTYNLHILAHIAESIQNLGINSNFSSYALEDHIGKLKKKVRRFSNIGPSLLRVFMNDFKFSECVETQIKTWRLNNKERKYFGIDSTSYRITKIQMNRIPDNLVHMVLSAVNLKYNVETDLSCLKFFTSILYKGIRYSTKEYCQKKQRNDSYVLVQQNKFYVIKAIVEYKAEIVLLCSKIVTKNVKIEFSGFSGYFSFNLEQIHEIIKIEGNLCCLEIDAITKKCIFINSSTFHYKYKSDYIAIPFINNK